LYFWSSYRSCLTVSLSGRLNKIGKNPCLVSNKENLSAEDSKTVDAFLKALATKESVDSFDKPSTPREHSPFLHFIYFVQSSQFATPFRFSKTPLVQAMDMKLQVG
jgi:hypothetical protein